VQELCFAINVLDHFGLFLALLKAITGISDVQECRKAKEFIEVPRQISFLNL
jgi:hypothetical protein